MSITLKKLADEIGVSKQAVYKRVTGKLKTVLAPYTHTEYNRMCFDDEGARIIKNDFEENPCSTSLPNNETLRSTYENTEYIQSAYVSPPDNSGAHTVLNTEHIHNKEGTHTETIPNTSAPLPRPTPNHIQNAPEHEQITYNTHTEDDYNIYNTHTEQIGNAPYANSAHSASDTERIGNTYGAELQKENEKLREELAKMKEAMHEKEIELVKSDAEREKLEETIKHLNQRIEDKDVQITEQRQMLQKTDDERKILTASLFRNNEFIERLMRLSLTKRIFGWRNVQKSLMESQNDIADDVTGEGTVTVQPEDTDDN